MLTWRSAQALIDATVKGPKVAPPGTVAIHHNETGFFREVYAEEQGVLEAIKKYMEYTPAYNLEYFRVDDPREPQFDPNDLYSIIPTNQKKTYNTYEVMARLFDNSEFFEYKKGYGPEMITGLAKLDGPAGRRDRQRAGSADELSRV